MTLAELAITVSLLAGLGLVASRLGLSAIPAYLFAGLRAKLARSPRAGTAGRAVKVYYRDPKSGRERDQTHS